MLDPNINLLAYGTDSYKVTHWKFYPKGTTFIYSYGEPRSGGMFPNVTLFGLQYIVSQFAGTFVTTERIDEAEQIANEHIGPGVFNRAGWERIRDQYNGHIPLKIKALPEGTTVPESNALFTIENLAPEEPWLTNWFETIISHVWYPTTVMTSTIAIRSVIANYLEMTGTPEDLPFKLHDFGYRGVTCFQQAAIGGGAVLAAGSMGTDNMAALYFVKEYYGADTMPAFSIRATEHSIMTIRGKEGEADVVRRVLDETPNDQMVAMVGDSFDMIEFVKTILATPDIKARIEIRSVPLIIRPDSGELPQIDVDVFKALQGVFGSETNHKGYHVLPPYLRLIQGDGIKWYKKESRSGKFGTSCSTIKTNRHTIEDILEAFEKAGISADNIAFGSGGGLIQNFNRDTQRFAIKCSYTERNGVGSDVYKQPATDPKKNSKRGKLAVIKTNNGIETVKQYEITNFEDRFSMLNTVFENGILTNTQPLEEIRKRAQV